MNYLNQIFSTVKEQSPIAYRVVLIHFLLAALCMGGLFIDDRTLIGVNVWIKPLKFALSGGIYILTLSYLMNVYPYSNRKKKIINRIVSWTLLIEIMIVVSQAARGVQSHYNQASPYDGILFAIMGLFIGANVLIMVLFVIDTMRLKLNTPKSVQWAILLGWIIVLAGSWVGGQMISQLSHNVGVADGGAGLPLVNWSTIGGDLRIAHFFGLHGIQIIPLFALWLAYKWKGTSQQQIIAVTFFGLVYASWIAFTFYQAKLGMPLVAL